MYEGVFQKVSFLSYYVPGEPKKLRIHGSRIRDLDQPVMFCPVSEVVISYFEIQY